jgi:two-component system sensor histidine kinase RpfC
MDVNMPEISGYDATKLYRMAHLDGPHLPIIALTADATTETERLCREAGMDAVLTKPVDAAQLLAAVASAVPQNGEPGFAPPSVVTPISSHPKFAIETAAVVDEEKIGALRVLGEDSSFFIDVITTFRADARLILQKVKRAIEDANLREFKDQTHALRSTAANVGGAKLCQVLLSMRDVTAKDLRQDGRSHFAKLETEFLRLDAALGQKLSELRHG